MVSLAVTSSDIIRQTGEHVMKSTSNPITGEWGGAVSQKFNTSKRHLPNPTVDEKTHPLFSLGSKRHFDPKNSEEFKWKPSLVPNHNKDAPRPEKKTGVKKIDTGFLGKDEKPRAERRHANTEAPAPWESQKTGDDALGGKQTFIHDNRKTQKEHEVEKNMGMKKRTGTMYEARNGLPMKSLGDKIYSAPEYQSGFFRDGGLIAGST
jgi:hypothetical protein